MCREVDDNVSRATVYRTLSMLETANFVEALETPEGMRRFEHTIGHEHHDHMICTRCSKILEFRDERIEAAPARASGLGAQGFKHDVAQPEAVRCLCAKCLAASRRNPSEPASRTAHERGAHDPTQHRASSWSTTRSTSRRAVSFFLRRAGYDRRRRALRVKTRCALLEQNHYGLVISDIRMPRMSGLKLLDEDHAARDRDIEVVLDHRLPRRGHRGRRDEARRIRLRHQAVRRGGADGAGREGAAPASAQGREHRIPGAPAQGPARAPGDRQRQRSVRQHAGAVGASRADRRQRPDRRRKWYGQGARSRTALHERSSARAWEAVRTRRLH
jgi:Fe2+ or Zn2+ uptake regulation protein/CheY-like chemotaxis protein